MPEPFLVDANFFIQAHRLYYPMDVVPNFWKTVKELADDGLIISIDKVRSEIAVGKDSLTTWCQGKLHSGFFQDTSGVATEYAQLANWTTSMASHYTSAAISEFLGVDEADAWLVAYARSHGNTIVTYEISEPNRKNRIKIPDAGFSKVPCINTIEMFRTLGRTF